MTAIEVARLRLASSEEVMVVAFFSEGPLAAMAALLARTGLAAIGSPPAELAFEEYRAGRRVGTFPMDSVLAFVAMHRRHDVVLALPLGLLADARIREVIDVAVSVGPDVGGAVQQVDAANWHLGSGDEHSSDKGAVRSGAFAHHGRAPILPLRLPDIHPTASTFMRDGVPCAPPVRDALKLVAVLQALAADPDASDVEACLRELLLADVPDGTDVAVDRLRAIADRLDAMPRRTCVPVHRRTTRGTCRGGLAPRRAAVGLGPPRMLPGAPCRSAGRRR